MTRYAPQWLQAGSYSGSQDRRLIAALWPNPASAGGAATVQASTMSVSVAAGQCAVPTVNGTGSTLCTWDAAELVTCTAAPGNPNSRIDLITVFPQSSDVGNGTGDTFTINVVAGTPAPTPTVPATPAGQVALWQVYVGSGVAALVQGNLTDVRPGGLAVGVSGSAPRGRMGSIVGPSSPVACGQTVTTVLQLTGVALTAGRRYRCTATIFGSQGSTASGQTYATIAAASGGIPSGMRVFTVQPLAANAFTVDSFAWDYTAGSNVTETITMSAVSASSGTFTVNANLSQITLEDIGT